MPPVATEPATAKENQGTQSQKGEAKKRKDLADAAKGTQPLKKFKLSLREVLLDDNVMTAPAVGPALEPANAATRFVLVPSSTWPALAGLNVGGWIGKIMKVGTSKQQAATIKLQDGSQLFTFAHVAETFKPLSREQLHLDCTE